MSPSAIPPPRGRPAPPTPCSPSFLAPIGGFAFLAILLAALAGCAEANLNKAWIPADKDGYRFEGKPKATAGSDDIYVILAFSGGGTRAAAFSFGALEGLRDTTYTTHGRERSLLDDVAIISSVSGGSFTAAYYGLHGQKDFFAAFPDRFLYRDVQLGLALRLLNPVTLWRLASPSFSRIDMAAEYYDDTIFSHKTFNDFDRSEGRPFIVLNATDMSFVGRFEFTQQQFDLIGSDLGSYPVARGVAASSAFPILLCPLTLKNYGPAPGFSPPTWLTDATRDRQVNSRYYANAEQNESYLDSTSRPFIHLMDGGLADNIGLRGPTMAVVNAPGLWTLGKVLETRKYLVVIAVNARASGRKNDQDQKETPPGIAAVLSTVTGGPMDNFSADTVEEMEDYLQSQEQAYQMTVEAHKKDPSFPVLAVPPKVYPIELAFEDIADPNLKDMVNAAPTNYSLSRGQVDALRRAARELLANSEGLRQLRADLAKGQ